MLSHDAFCVNDWFPPDMSFGDESHHCHISRDVIPALRAAGVSEGDIPTMLVDNPRRILERRAGY